MSAQNNSNAVEIALLGRRERLMRDLLAGSYRLKHTSIAADRSAPKFDGVQLKKTYNRRFLMDAVREPRKLSHVSRENIRDRSAPIIDMSLHIRFVERRSFLDNVLQGAENFYGRLLGTVSSLKGSLRSSTQYLASSAQSLALSAKDTTESIAHTAVDTTASLAHNAKDSARSLAHTAVDTTASLAHSAVGTAQSLAHTAADTTASLAHSAKDSARSLAFSAKDALEQTAENLAAATSARRSLLADIAENRALLKHIPSNNIRDRSKPFLPSQFALEQTRRNESLARTIDARSCLLSDIRNKAVCRSLNHVATRDLSRPAISGQFNLHKWDRKALLQEVVSPAAHDLCAVTAICDRSAPILPTGAIDLNKNERKELLKEVKVGVELSHPHAIKDRSAPSVAM